MTDGVIEAVGNLEEKESAKEPRREAEEEEEEAEGGQGGAAGLLRGGGDDLPRFLSVSPAVLRAQGYAFIALSLVITVVGTSTYVYQTWL